MKIGIGCDHAGLEMKKEILALLDTLEVEYHDFGTDSNESVDYPDVARPVAEAVAAGEYDRGILVCGTGIGMEMTANRVPGIRAANCFNEYMARMARAHNDANVLALGERILGPGIAREIVKAWISTSFEGGRHQRRVDKI